MAIAFDAVTTTSGYNSTISFSHTIGSGSNRIVFFYLWIVQGGPTTSITYNGVAMTLLRLGNPGGGSRAMRVYYLVNPPTGTNSVSVTISTTVDWVASLVSYTGVNQSSPFANDGFVDQASVTSLPRTITTSFNNSWHLGFGFGEGENSGAGTGTVRRDSIASELSTLDNNFAIAISTSNAIEVTRPTTNPLSMISFELKGGPTPYALNKGSYTITGKSLTLFLTNYIINLSKGAYVITGKEMVVFKNYVFQLLKGAYNMVGGRFRLKFLGWRTGDKPTTNWSEGSKPTSNWTNKPK